MGRTVKRTHTVSARLSDGTRSTNGTYALLVSRALICPRVFLLAVDAKRSETVAFVVSRLTNSTRRCTRVACVRHARALQYTVSPPAMTTALRNAPAG